MARVKESVLQVDVNEQALYGGAELLVAKMGSSRPIQALGNAIALFENAVLMKQGAEAVELAIDIAWLARECGLRRGDWAYTDLVSRPR